MGIEIIKGDIMQADKDIIVQQVNCKGLMGAKLSRTIMTRYPNVFKEYRKFYTKTLKRLGNEESLLGLVNYIDVYDGKIIANVFGQQDVRKGKEDKTVYTDVKSLLFGIEEVKDKAERLGFSIAIPTYIGCGMANGDWSEVKAGIENIFEGTNIDVKFYHYRAEE